MPRYKRPHLPTCLTWYLRKFYARQNVFQWYFSQFLELIVHLMFYFGKGCVHVGDEPEDKQKEK
jgi:hypothetical protein